VSLATAVDNDFEMEVSAVPRPAPRRGGPRLPVRMLRLASDERLVELVRAGSESAFEAIFDRHHRGVLAFCRHMLGSPEEAEDAVQHAFMAAYRDMVGSSKPIQLRAWLYTIARNRCLSMLRARRERAMGELEEPATDNLAADVQRRQDLRDLLCDLARLPEDQRAALVLAELGDVSHEEIATVLGCRRERVKALVFQARSSLAASRTARETPCQDIREQLATLDGGVLRRNTIRRHLRDCPGCRAFRDHVRTQRRMLAVALPVVPSAALKQGVLGAVLSGGAGAGGAATGAAAGGATATAASAGGAVSAGGVGASAIAAKALVAVAVAGGGTAAGVSVLQADGQPARPAAPASAVGGGKGGAPPPSRGGAPAAMAPAAGASEQDEADQGKGRGRERHARRGGDTRRGRGSKATGRGAERNQAGTERGKSEQTPRGPSTQRPTKVGRTRRGGERATKRPARARTRTRRRSAQQPRALNPPKLVKTPRPAPTATAEAAPVPAATASPEPTPAATEVP